MHGQGYFEKSAYGSQMQGFDSLSTKFCFVDLSLERSRSEQKIVAHSWKMVAGNSWQIEKSAS